MPKKIIIFSLIAFLFLFCVNLVFAADPVFIIPQPKIPIPGMSKLEAPRPCTEDWETIGTGDEECYEIPWIAQYIGGLYKFGVSVLAILAVVVIAWGGIIWLTAGGSATQVTKAKDHILGGITGLILGLSSYILLATLNPDLINLKAIKIITITGNEYKEVATTLDAFTSGCSNEGGSVITLITLNDQTSAQGSCSASCINKDGVKEVRLSTDGLKACCICNKKPNLIFAPGINRSDASTLLNILINCMDGTSSGTITSISDSNGGANCYNEHPDWQQCQSSNQKNCCFHTKNSCHYGGRNCISASYALDVVGNTAELKRAAATCMSAVGGQTPKCLDEGNHLHISVGESCGCDTGMAVCNK